MDRLTLIFFICVTIGFDCSAQSIEKLELSSKPNVGITFSQDGDIFSFLSVESTDEGFLYNGTLVSYPNTNKILFELTDVNLILPVNDSIALVVDSNFESYLYDFFNTKRLRNIELLNDKRSDINDFKVAHNSDHHGIYYKYDDKIYFNDLLKNENQELVAGLGTITSFAISPNDIVVSIIKEAEKDYRYFYRISMKDSHEIEFLGKFLHTSLSYEPMISFLDKYSILFSTNIGNNDTKLNKLILKDQSVEQISIMDLKIISMCSNLSGTVLMTILNESDRIIELPFDSIEEIKNKIFNGMSVYKLSFGL